MLRIYCDSNIFRYLKKSHLLYNNDLFVTFETLRDKMLFTFSEAHLDDLKDSDLQHAEIDLKLMGEYVQDNYFMHDLIYDKRTHPYLKTPIEAFKGKDYKKYNEALSNPFDIKQLLRELEKFPEGRIVKPLLTNILNIPINLIPGKNYDHFMDDNSKTLLSKIIPGYNPLMNVQDLMEIMWPYSKAILEDKKELTELRKYISSYLKRDDYKFETWGMEFNEKFKDTSIGKTFLEFIDGTLVGNQKNDQYQRFISAYNMLELFNITQERSGKSSKKFNFQSLNTDAQHAWFATFNDYLITDDKGLQIKALIVTQLLKYPLKILSSTEFITNKKIFSSQEKNLQAFFASVDIDLKNSIPLFEEFDYQTNKISKTFAPRHIYFNYFNRFELSCTKEAKTIEFYCDRESHANLLMIREVELLVSKLNIMLGKDVDSRNAYKMDEHNSNNEAGYIRKWVIGKRQFFLIIKPKNWGATLCLNMKIYY